MLKKITISLFALLALQGLMIPLFGQETTTTTVESLNLNGASLSSLWALPFLGMILSIAIFPLVLPDFWSKHFGKVSFIWAAIVVIGLGLTQGVGVSLHSLIVVMFEQFLPFIFLLIALFTITGGIKLHGDLVGSPKLNTLILLIGAILSSWLGTTGAAVLLIRPLINANNWRTFKVHTMIFFIFIVGNIGGSLTPVGNPPLLMGFISKIPFFWPLTKLLAPTAVATIILLVIYYFMDIYFMKKETAKPEPSKEKKSITIEGGWNFLLLIAVVGAVMVSSLNIGTAFTLYHVEMPLSELIEILGLIAIAFISMKITKKSTREANNFTWHPMLEVGKIFAGIFVCMAPLIAMLRAGANGPMSFIIDSLTSNGHPANGMYYWLSGGLSAFLDSAPAYLVFFNTAAAGHGDALAAAQFMMTDNAQTLIAITAGASFMGAITYIGNAPNMMVKAIAEEGGIKMPSFFGYMAWSIAILIPLFILIQFLFI